MPSQGNETLHQQIWLSFFLKKKQGTVGFENQINKCLELAEYLYAKIKNREEFEMVFDGEVSCHPGLHVSDIYWWKFTEGSFWSCSVPHYQKLLLNFHSMQSWFTSLCVHKYFFQ